MNLEKLGERLSSHAADAQERLEGLEKSQRALLSAQVLMVDEMRTSGAETDRRIAELAESQKRTDGHLRDLSEDLRKLRERISALIHVVDGLARR